MKGYLVTTGILFAVLAMAHLLRTIGEWQHLSTNPWLAVTIPGIGVLSGVLSFWAWRLFRLSANRRSS